MITLARRPVAWLALLAASAAVLPAPALASDADASDARAAALLNRLRATYQEARSLSRGAATMTNLPPSQMDEEMGTLGLSELATTVSRADDGTIEQFHYEDMTGSLQLSGNSESLIIRQAWWDGQCAGAPWRATDGSRAIFTSVVALQRAALEPATFVPTELMLAIDGSFDVLLGAPVQAELLPENHEMTQQLSGMTEMSQAGGATSRLLLTGKNATAALAMSDETGMLVSAVLEIDLSHLGAFDAPGLRVWIAQAFTDLGEGDAEQPEACDRIFPSIGDLHSWNRAYSTEKILEAKEMLEPNLQMMKMQLSTLDENDPRREWGALYVSRMQRQLDEAVSASQE